MDQPTIGQLIAQAHSAVSAVDDDPRGRLQMRRAFYRKYGHGLFSKGYGRSEIDFMRWELKRGVLNPLDDTRQPGSPWWRTVNSGFLFDGHLGELVHEAGLSTHGVPQPAAAWMRYIADPTPKTWYAAHNTSIVTGYLDGVGQADQEIEGERFFMNVVLYRLLFAQAMVEERPYALGELGEIIADPQGSAVHLALHSTELYPRDYPLTPGEVRELEHPGLHLQDLEVRVLDEVLILPHLGELYTDASEWNSVPALRSLQKDGKPCYAEPERAGKGESTSLVPDLKSLGSRISGFLHKDRQGVLEKVGAGLLEKAEDGVLHLLGKASTDDRVKRIIERNRGRGIPIPKQHWASYQVWSELLFASWPIAADVLRPKIPEGLDLDTFDGTAWISLLPMNMAKIRFPIIGQIPFEGSFPELNFRTYVSVGGRGGVYFFHIDAPDLLADIGARLFFHTPYTLASVDFDPQPGGAIEFASRRLVPSSPDASMVCRYEKKGTPAPAEPGSLTHFLIERYCSYAVDHHGTVLRGDIVHDPWMVQDVEAEVTTNTVLAAEGLELPPTPPSVHYSVGTDTVLWLFKKAG